MSIPSNTSTASRQPRPDAARSRLNRLRPATLLAVALSLLAGCATDSIERRGKERAAAYAALSPDDQRLVNAGLVRVGMSEDAVYIAMGRPTQVVRAGDAGGESTTWLYYGGYMQATRYWAYRETGRGDELFLERYLVTDYQPQTYLRAEITFVQGRVARWRTLPQPPSG